MKTLIFLTRDEDKSNKDEFTSTWGQLSDNFAQIDVGQNKVLLIRRHKGKTPQDIADEIKRNLSPETEKIGVLYHQPPKDEINNIFSTNYLYKYDFIATYSLECATEIEQLAKNKSVISYEKVWDYYYRMSPLNLTLDILRLALCKKGAIYVNNNSGNYPVVFCVKTEELIKTLISGDDKSYIKNYNNLRNYLIQNLYNMNRL